MKRVGYSRSYPSVLGSEAIEGCDGIGVAQHDGNLAAFGAEGRLPLRSGLRGGHGSARHFAHVLKALIVGLHRGQLHSGGFAADRHSFGDGEPALFHCNPHQRAALGTHGVSESAGFCETGSKFRVRLAKPGIYAGAGGSDGFGLGHFVLRVGPIPTMCPSYPVTSDKSTTVRREAA